MDARALARFRRNRGAVIGLAIVVVITLFSFLGPLLTSHAPHIPDFERGRGPFGTPGAPSSLHWLGTDTIFRDVFVRLAHGGRLSLEVAFVSTVIAMGIGTAVGVLSGYFKGERLRVDALLDGVTVFAISTSLLLFAFGSTHLAFRVLGGGADVGLVAALLRTLARVEAVARRRRLSPIDVIESAAVLGFVFFVVRRAFAPLTNHLIVMQLLSAWAVSLVVRVLEARRRPKKGARYLRVDVDDALMRAVDVLLSFPFLLLLMALSATIEKTSEATIFLVLGLTAWTHTARVIRSKTLQVRELEFIVASRALGQPTPSILLRHVLPNVAGAAIVLATNSVAAMIVAEAALSFLGLSVPPPAASWGRMLDEGRPYYAAAPWLLIAPGTAILLAVLGFNLLGEGVRDAFDPRAGDTR